MDVAKQILSDNDKVVEIPTIEVIELVCQNTPDWTHGTVNVGI